MIKNNWKASMFKNELGLSEDDILKEMVLGNDKQIVTINQEAQKLDELKSKEVKGSHFLHPITAVKEKRARRSSVRVNDPSPLMLGSSGKSSRRGSLSPAGSV